MARNKINIINSGFVDAYSDTSATLGASIVKPAATFKDPGHTQPLIVTVRCRENSERFTPSAFPENPYGNTYAVQVDDMNASSDLSAVQCLRVEYGQGGMTNTLYCDIREGSFNLPPCEFARVSVVNWQRVLNFPVWAGLSVGQLQGAQPPVFTGRYVFSAAAQSSVRPPAFARMVDCWAGKEADAIGDALTIRMYATAAASPQGLLERNYATGIQWPLNAPVEFGGGISSVGLSASAAAEVFCRWYLQP